MTAAESYIPNARDAVIARFGRTSYGLLRCYCNACHDADPLAPESGLTEPARVYGDLYVAIGSESRMGDEECCASCGVSLLGLSQRCQADHDDQQARWARIARPTVLLEYGLQSSIRCRVY